MKTPVTVLRAIWIIVINSMLMYYIFDDKFQDSPLRPQSSEVQLYSVLVGLIGVLLLLAYAISRRQNWARICISLFGALIAILVFNHPHYRRWIDVVTLVFAALWIAIIYELFSEPSSAWFRKPKSK